MFTSWKWLIICCLSITLLIGIWMRQDNKPQPIISTTTTTTINEYTLLGTYKITAYSSIESCHYPKDNLCLMADGRIAEIGAIACPRSFILGTEFRINGKEYICRDRYNKYLSERFDVWFGYGIDNYLRAKEWGVKYLEVYIKP